ncbi:MAG: ribosome silencing factor [Gammaproteobacteria bacterium]|jgi:ribosome-associated protein|nr:ribosome silencing factor [Gammaproteobacteria bacterium]MBT4462864.1 ribosome silencing factor [Gammaproteobacteria bacterium]MBT4655133.1 ribosome silencing factor [Gammaproteobacteria bacterium]MBT5116719.1 ribosome silencing factor [Gammaproteobacteria bacterium]MBT5761817.1 ribosome silencing factor [Gammaproteobacteria bacterium]
METLKKSIISILEDNKAENITLIDMKGKSSVTDLMFIVSGRSTRHVKSIADNLITKLKKNKIKPIGVEGFSSSEWILLDYGDLLVHVMHPETREFYSLEKLWDENIETDNYTYI